LTESWAYIVVVAPFFVASIALVADWDVGIVAVIVTGVFIIDNVNLRICAIVQQ